MKFYETKLERILETLETLGPNQQPNWGKMSPQRMVEHLTDTVNLSIGSLGQQALRIPENKVEKAQAFLDSDLPMPKNYVVDFVSSDKKLRNTSLQESIDEFKLKWLEFESYYAEAPKKTNLHPEFGHLNHKQWLRIHSKHFTHHFQQFDLI